MGLYPHQRVAEGVFVFELGLAFAASALTPKVHNYWPENDQNYLLNHRWYIPAFRFWIKENH
jgi:hypothetical protein